MAYFLPLLLYCYLDNFNCCYFVYCARLHNIYAKSPLVCCTTKGQSLLCRTATTTTTVPASLTTGDQSFNSYNSATTSTRYLPTLRQNNVVTGLKQGLAYIRIPGTHHRQTYLRTRADLSTHTYTRQTY